MVLVNEVGFVILAANQTFHVPVHFGKIICQTPTWLELHFLLRELNLLSCCRRQRNASPSQLYRTMKTSCAHLALASVLSTCTGGVALAFVTPTTSLPRGDNAAHHALGSTTQRSAAARASFSGGVARRPLAPREGVRLAAREDCKSCMEQDLLAAEAAAGRGVEEDDREGRRALFEEVRFSGTPQLQCVTQNPPAAPSVLSKHSTLGWKAWC